VLGNLAKFNPKDLPEAFGLLESIIFSDEAIYILKNKEWRGILDSRAIMN
jgi:hypothetical protein